MDDLGEELNWDELLTFKRELKRKHGKCEFVPKSQTIFIKDPGGEYPFPIGSYSNSSQLLNMIFQIRKKTWITPELLSDLLACINDAVYWQTGKSVQDAYCPGGNSLKVDWNAKSAWEVAGNSFVD